MPAESENVVTISCDNPNCPGNSLDPANRTGWTFVTTEVYGEATQSHVYCSAVCAESIGTVLREAEIAAGA